ncbi:WXG100 family type VII secretion target [Nocardia vaccinii]|uniref:WXG100 family type VII secretion target n=1 Tax=Nocardia vaccinii TaxID=1822 RepID=UPI00082F0ED8|nr:WXG100 family type VII secretion target [Nocardia vaccinii]
MAAEYSVDLVGLQRLVDDTAKLEATIEDLAAEIDKSIEQLHVTWTGAAADAHRAAHDNRIAAVSEMREALSMLRAKLATAHAAYHRVGPTNQGMWPQ